MTKMILSPFSETIVADGSSDLNSADPTGAGGAPLAPTSFTVTYLSDTSLSLAWTDNASNELSFELDRSPNGTDTWTALTSPAANATSAISTGLTVDTQYFYRLRAVNAVGNSAYATANGLTTVPAGPTSTPNLFRDDFEDGTMEVNSIRGVALNTNDFQWAGNNRTSLVTMEPQLFSPSHCDVTHVSGEPTAIYNSALICSGPQSPAGGGDWAADSGNVSLRFRFPGEPAQIGTGETLAEQYWSMPIASGVSDYWIRYRVRVPVNYVNDLTNANSKFLAIFMNTYGGIGAGAVWNMRPKGDTGSYLTVAEANGNQQPSAGSNGETTIGDLINVPADRGAWITMVMRFKAATSDGANDGEIHTYHMKSGQTTFTEMTALTGLNTYVAGGLAGIRGGYFQGSHKGYQDDTEWLMDTVEMSSGSLI